MNWLENTLSSNSELLCRTCLRPHKYLSDIFRPIQNDQLASQILMDLTSVKIENTDKLPKKICSNCLDKLVSAYDFKTLVIQSETTLHSFYSNIKNEHLQLEQLENNGEDYYLLNLSNNDDVIPFAIKEEDPSNKNETVDLLINSDIKDPECKNIIMNSEQFKSIILIDNSKICTLQEEDDSVSFDSISHDPNDMRNRIDMLIKQNDELVSGSQVEIFRNKRKINDISETDNTINKLHIPLQNTNNLPTSDREATIFLYDNTKKDLILGFIEESDYEHLKSLLAKQRKNVSLCCKVCKKSFSYRHFFNAHLQQHLGYLPYKCDICQKQFSQLRILNLHKYKHDRTKSSMCHICGKKVKSYSWHMSVMHSANVGQHKCTLCTKTFINKYILNHHLRRRHIGERPYVCELCGKAFYCQAELRNHSDIHITARAFKCSECERDFTTERRLKLHKKSHQESRLKIPGKFECFNCGKRFKDKQILKNHVLIHTGAKPHACELCGKKFRQKTAMKTHMRIHTGETPYVCKECPAKYKYPQQLTYHMKKHEK